MNERNTENLVRDMLREAGYKEPKILVEEQKSSIPSINKLLKNASKQGSGQGNPEFIITSKEQPNFVFVIECKADVTKHKSKTLDKYKDYAVDGAKLYSSYLSKENDVLFVGVSGQNKKELKISHYLQLKNDNVIHPLDLHNNIYKFEEYVGEYKQIRFRKDYSNLFKYVKELNINLHKNKIPEDKRAILFSGILIALEDDTFLETYKSYRDNGRLSNILVSSIVSKLKEANLKSDRIYEFTQAFSFIKTHTALIDEGYLLKLVSEIHENMRTFIKSDKYFDIVSQFYVEFLKYANNDANLGIVLTPEHITDLFCDLASINQNSVVLDSCCGTGGFLISAMRHMIKDAKKNTDKIKNIKSKQLIGIEYQDHIYTLCCSNMILHGDGKTNIIKGDCFSKVKETKELHPNIGLLNPPYNTGKDELEFVLNNLEAIEPNGVVVAIVPMSCALYQKGAGLALKQRLLDKHTLEAVCSMPDDLFYPVGVVTCIMVFKAQKPHPKGYKTYFGYWKNDGFIKKKNQGRINSGEWQNIKSDWLHSFFNKEVKSGLSIMQEVTAEDEWCAEAYMETDYSKLTEEDFIKTIKDYVAYKFMASNNDKS